MTQTQGSTVRLLRNALRMQQKEFAALTRCKTATIQSLESGRRRLTPNLAKRIARATGICPDWLRAGNLNAPLIDKWGKPYNALRPTKIPRSMSTPVVHDLAEFAFEISAIDLIAYTVSLILWAYRRDPQLRAEEIIVQLEACCVPAELVSKLELASCLPDKLALLGLNSRIEELQAIITALLPIVSSNLKDHPHLFTSEFGTASDQTTLKVALRKNVKMGAKPFHESSEAERESARPANFKK